MKIIFMLTVALFSLPVFAGEVRIAVASNFIEPIKEISLEFERVTKHKVILSFGATGAFYSQISNGAPFDILLAADNKIPAKLINENQAVAKSKFTYAQGQLALWSTMKNKIDKEAKILNNKFNFMAVADPKLAPYGIAAKQTLKKMNLWEFFNKNKKIVFGKNIGQTLQFVESGNAEIGFVAYSQIYKEGVETKGSYWLVPSDYYDPIIQDAVILNYGKNNIAANEFMVFLKSTYAENVIKSYGYICK